MCLSSVLTHVFELNGVQLLTPAPTAFGFPVCNMQSHVIHGSFAADRPVRT